MIVISAVSCWLKKKKVAETESLRDSRRLRALPPAVSKEKTYTQKIRMKARGMGEKKWRGQSDTKLVARRGGAKEKDLNRTGSPGVLRKGVMPAGGIPFLLLLLVYILFPLLSSATNQSPP